MSKQRTADFISVSEAAAILGVTDRQIRNLIADGILPAQQVGRAYVIRRADLARVPKDRKPGPKPKQLK
jgi:excisionase family DNA binding protein